MTKVLKLSQILEPKNLRVGDMTIQPMSCTNKGIFLREEKFSKNLSKSLAKNKIAHKGDFIFGMSRKILNFGMMKFSEGSFSSAYKVYKCKFGYEFSVFLDLYIRLNHDYFFQCISGGAREGQSISEDILFNLEVNVPDNNDIENLVRIVDFFNSKIELYQQMNETLEEIAMTLFKSWFIDFDPVRAKAEGRPTVLSKEISDLFPDSFEDSELGKIPKGWQIIRLKDLAKEVGKKIKKGKETEEKPYVPIDEISSEQLFLSQYKNGDEANSSLVSFLKDDILFGAMRPYFHKVCISPFDGTTRTTCLVLNSIDKCYSSFLVFFLFQKSTIDYATQNSTGSTIPYIKWQNYLENLELCLPPKEIGLEFKEFTSPILKKFQQHIFETRNLSNMRDTLLPKLISGELKIPDTENLIEEASI
tara:strand:- start:732 stop:1985 length:1254 start_codon:yes stop_codon:yes gene_type:complete